MTIKGNPSISWQVSDTGTTTSATQATVLCIGIKLPSGSLPVDTPQRILSDSEVDLFSGQGSQLAQMLNGVRDQFRRAPLWAIAVDAAVGTAAEGVFTFGGTATTANPLLIQVEQETITIPVTIGDAGTDIAISAAAALLDYPDLHVTGAANLATLELTARSHGEHGDLISLKAFVEGTPPGVTATVSTPMAGGAGSPDVGSALAALGGTRFNYIVCPDINATNLIAIETTLEDRFTSVKVLDGHAFIGLRDTVSAMASFALGEDTKQITVMGDPKLPDNPWRQAAVWAGARAAKSNPKLSIYDTPLQLTAPSEGDYLPPDDRNTLLEAGASVYDYVAGKPRVARMVTLAKTNSDGQTSAALYETETKLTVSEWRAYRYRITVPEIGKTLVDDASDIQYAPDVAGEIIDADGYRDILITQVTEEILPLAWLASFDDWAASLVVTKTNSNTLSAVEAPEINGILYFVDGEINFTV